MEQAQDPGDALRLYKTILHHHASLREALEGAGRTAFLQGRYLEAKKYLARSLEGSGVEQEPATVLAENRDRLNEATRLLLLYPSSRLRPSERSARILKDGKLAQARLAQCANDDTPASSKDAGAATAPAPNATLNPLKNFASHFSRHPAGPAKSLTAAPPPVDPLQALEDRWKQLPAKISSADLMNDPDLAQTQIQLIYDTEITTRQLCGAPAGDDDL